MIVVDASLATKWLVVEAEQDVALSFFERYARILAAPDLLVSEVAGAIVRRANENRFTRTEALTLLKRWTDLCQAQYISFHRLSADLVGRAGGIAIEIGHPVGDCLYLALALELDCPLATCDAKFRDRAIGIYPNIKLLAEFAAPAPRN